MKTLQLFLRYVIPTMLFSILILLTGCGSEEGLTFQSQLPSSSSDTSTPTDQDDSDTSDIPDTPDTPNEPDTPIVAAPLVNQALLGPLSGSVIRVYTFDDLKNPIEGPLTSVDDPYSLQNAGRFDVALQGLNDDDWIIITATGGLDIDANDNSVIDHSGTINNGTIHAITKVSDAKSGMNISVVTEIAYLTLKPYFERDSFSAEAIDAYLSTIARSLLSADLTGDGGVDYRDLLIFNPLNAGHKNTFILGYSSLFSGNTLNIIPEIHDGNDISEAVVELFGETLKPVVTTTLSDSIEIDLVKVEKGSFQMGGTTAQAQADELPAHTVRIAQDYWIGAYEVTQEQYYALMGQNPSRFQGAKKPVEQVSWEDAIAFCDALTAQQNNAGTLPVGYEYRLPTEAEWEFAARGGNRSKNYRYAGGDDIENVAWYADNSGSIPHSVGGKRANELGIYDMSGNVWEWCLGWYNSTYYTTSLINDPYNDSVSLGRVFHGGAWSNKMTHTRVSNRNMSYPRYTNYSLGFRIVRAPLR